MTELVRYAAQELRGHVAELVLALGARAADAQRVAEALVDADLCGHRSHGVRQLPYYAGQIRRGEIDVAAETETLLDVGSLAVLDGRRAFGHVVAAEAARRVAVSARCHRVAAIAVRNANHIGRLGEYTEMLAAEGQVAILLVSAQGADQQVAPFGGIDRRLSNNPLSLAVPGPEYPVVLDMALSEAAESRVLHAADLGVEVPPGWLLDAAGCPSNQPRDYLAGGSLLPVGAAAGSHKGYSLIVLVELIVGLLAEVALCGAGTPPFSNAFVLLALDAAGAAAARGGDITALTEWLKSARRLNGSEILIPGELEARRRREAAEIVMLDRVTVAQLGALAAELGIPSSVSNDAPPPPSRAAAHTRSAGAGGATAEVFQSTRRMAEQIPDAPERLATVAPPPTPSRATAERILAFHCGGDWSPMAVYDPLATDGGRLVYGPYLLFLVEHPRGRVLFDAGLHPKWKQAGEQRRINIAGDAVDLLARGGVAPGDVEHVVASHLHYDHAGGLQFFPEALVWVQADELRFAYRPAVYQRELYDSDDFDHPLRWQEVQGGHDLFGDGAVTLLPAPGHTPGHQALCVELPTGLHVLAADATYLEAAMRARHLPGVVWNPDAMVASWELLEGLERDRGARLIFTHDLAFRSRVPLAPEAWYE